MIVCEGHQCLNGCTACKLCFMIIQSCLQIIIRKHSYWPRALLIYETKLCVPKENSMNTVIFPSLFYAAFLHQYVSLDFFFLIDFQ